MGNTRSLFEESAGDGLDDALDAKRDASRCDARQFDHLVNYLLEYAEELREFPNGPGAERACRYGGSGTPAVSEFAVCEIASVLNLATTTASYLVADILDLSHRLPRLYQALHEGLVETWRVRAVASATRRFTLTQVDVVDRRLSADTVGDGTPMLCRMSRSRLKTVLDQIRGPGDDETEPGMDDRYASLRPAANGLAALSALLSAEDGWRLEQRITQIVGWLRTLGADRPEAILRSLALGYLAEPDSLDTLYHHTHQHVDGDGGDGGDGDPIPGMSDAANDKASTRGDDADASDDLDETDPTADLGRVGDDAGDESCDDAEDRADDDDAIGDRTPSTRRADEIPDAFRRRVPKRRLPATTVYLHLDRESGTWSMDGHGALSREDAVGIIGHSHVTVKPVIDLAENLTYTGYVAPPKLREQLALSNGGYCTFPSCHRPAHNGEYDHIRDYADGGPTSSRNGHRLCKHHHRAKTFTDWTVHTPTPGVWVWNSPAGRIYLVTSGQTIRLDQPRRREKPHAA